MLLKYYMYRALPLTGRAQLTHADETEATLGENDDHGSSAIDTAAWMWKRSPANSGWLTGVARRCPREDGS
jgi:hypothetical protein